MSVRVDKITEPMVVGEGPHWDDRAQALYFVDIDRHSIHKYVPSSRLHTKTELDGPVGFIVPHEYAADTFVVGVRRKFLMVCWDGREGSKVEVIQEFAEVDQGTRNKINDAKSDPRGRLFAGTMGYEHPPGNYETGKAALYRLDGVKVTQLADNISISNGMTWDVKEKAFYYTDSLEYNIRRYDYDVDTGEISNPNYIFDFKNKIEGFPDGFTIDTDGNLWVAVFNGSCVLKINPKSGKVLHRLDIPAKQVTSVTFGGPNLDVLFVTSASLKIGGEEQNPPCGCTFMVTGLGVRGYAGFNVKL